jgi:hypothetical protein
MLTFVRKTMKFQDERELIEHYVDLDTARYKKYVDERVALLEA